MATIYSESQLFILMKWSRRRRPSTHNVNTVPLAHKHTHTHSHVEHKCFTLLRNTHHRCTESVGFWDAFHPENPVRLSNANHPCSKPLRCLDANVRVRFCNPNTQTLTHNYLSCGVAVLFWPPERAPPFPNNRPIVIIKSHRMKLQQKRSPWSTLFA